MVERARYAYAVARGLDAPRLHDVVGVRGEPVSVISVGDLDAVVSDVPLDEFGEEGLKKHLEDLVWLEEVARAHNDVVWTVASLAPTAPMRLATIFLDDERVRARVDSLRSRLTEVLDRVEGRAEWSVKVVAPAAVDTEAPKAAAPTSGAEFLRRRRAEVDEKRQRHDDGVEVADRVYADLRQVSHAARLLPPQDPQLSGLRGAMLLNAAFLVGHDDGDRFAERVVHQRTAHPDVLVEVAGPWPPYSFATLDEL